MEDLTVTIKYKAQDDAEWTSVSAVWESVWNSYWYFDFAIPTDATIGLYDVTVEAYDLDGGFVTSTETGEFTVIL